MNTAKILRTWRLGLMGLAAFASGAASAQVTAVDPNQAIDGDLTTTASAPAPAPAPVQAPAPTPAPAPAGAPVAAPATVTEATPATATAGATAAADTATPPPGTYKQDDLIGAAEGLFGKGAQGLASMIQDLLKKQGEPDGYIVGREGGGAIMVGVRYGSGTLHHKIEGQKPVYWTGPSLGLDIGANVTKTFVLVYNLHNTADLYERFGAVEGQAYLIGGFHVSYMRHRDVVLIPVRMGAGLRLGANVGYMKFSEKQRWSPF